MNFVVKKPANLTTKGAKDITKGTIYSPSFP